MSLTCGRMLPKWTQGLSAKQRDTIHKVLQELDSDLEACFESRDPDADDPDILQDTAEDHAIQIYKDHAWRQIEVVLQETDQEALFRMKYELWEYVQSASSPYTNLVEHFY